MTRDEREWGTPAKSRGANWASIWNAAAGKVNGCRTGGDDQMTRKTRRACILSLLLVALTCSRSCPTGQSQSATISIIRSSTSSTSSSSSTSCSLLVSRSRSPTLASTRCLPTGSSNRIRLALSSDASHQNTALPIRHVPTVLATAHYSLSLSATGLPVKPEFIAPGYLASLHQHTARCTSAQHSTSLVVGLP